MDILTLSGNLTTYLIIGAFLFAIGIFGMVQRSSLIGMLISAELVLAGASLNFMAFNRFLAADPTTGKIFTLFIMAVAAAEASIALSIIIAVYRNYRSIAGEDVRDLEG